MNGTPSKKREFSNRGKKPSTYRRIVTGNVNGKAVVQTDEQMELYQFKTVPGYQHTLIWHNTATSDLSKEQRLDRYPDSVVPGPGGTSLHFVTFPPASVFSDPSFDGEAARDEALIRLRGLADQFEKGDPGMHKTNTVDYAIVLEGEIWAMLDEGGNPDAARRRAYSARTNHSWSNRSDQSCRIAFILIDAEPV